MAKLKKILAISGSTRQYSTNLNVLQAIALLYQGQIELVMFESITRLPQFNPDDTDADRPEVMRWRQQIREADGILICTPEYAHGVPGALKNAIDWTVSTNEFSHKPTALITASTDGRFGHAALLETLRTIEAKNIEALQLLISFAQTKIGHDNTIKDELTLAAIKKLIGDLLQTIDATPATT